MSCIKLERSFFTHKFLTAGAVQNFLGREAVRDKSLDNHNIFFCWFGIY